MGGIEVIDIDQRAIQKLHIIQVTLVRHAGEEDCVARALRDDDRAPPDRRPQFEPDRIDLELHRLMKRVEGFRLPPIRDGRETGGGLAMEISGIGVVQQVAAGEAWNCNSVIVGRYKESRSLPGRLATYR